jgi:hypothetical protein
MNSYRQKFICFFIATVTLMLSHAIADFSYLDRYKLSLFGWLVADGWCWFVLREEYCWLVALAGG